MGETFLINLLEIIQKRIKILEKLLFGQGHDYTIACLLFCYYKFLKKYYKLIAIHLSNQQTLDADPKGIQEINCAGNLDRAEGERMVFILEEVEKPFWIFRRNCESNVNVFHKYNFQTRFTNHRC